MPLTKAISEREIFDALRSAAGEAGVVTDPADVRAAALDGRGRRQGEALAVVRPASTPKRFPAS